MDSTAFYVIAILAIAAQSFLLFLAFFEPGLEYKVCKRPGPSPDSPEFLRILGILADAQVHHDTRVEVLTNGENFYEAELEAIRGARCTINIECYIFQKGEIARRFIEALTERARAGVRVNIVLDAIGSFNTWKRDFRGLIEAGGRVWWYQAFRWYNLPRINNRTHRELMIIDGEIGFIGGAGIADHWYKGKKNHPRWRDTMYRVTGSAVSGLQSMFAENWLESSGEMLTGEEYYPHCKAAGNTWAMAVNSTPSTARATRARMLFQTLIASARERIYITTPYFLPDASARRELCDALERGVEIKIIVPGHKSDHLLTRRSSRRLYGQLLRAGARIFEYQPSMIHAKSLIVDGIWGVVGSTNFDHRSFGLNDEVNLAAQDPAVAERMQEDFARDLAASEEITYKRWKQRSPVERVHEWLGWFLERQQ